MQLLTRIGALVLVTGLVAFPVVTKGVAFAATAEVNAIEASKGAAPVASSRARKYQGSRGGAR